MTEAELLEQSVMTSLFSGAVLLTTAFIVFDAPTRRAVRTDIPTLFFGSLTFAAAIGAIVFSVGYKMGLCS